MSFIIPIYLHFPFVFHLCPFQVSEFKNIRCIDTLSCSVGVFLLVSVRFDLVIFLSCLVSFFTVPYIFVDTSANFWFSLFNILSLLNTLASTPIFFLLPVQIGLIRSVFWCFTNFINLILIHYTFALLVGCFM